LVIKVIVQKKALRYSSLGNIILLIVYLNVVTYILDPCKATIGVGLGLPGFQPGVSLLHEILGF